MQLEIEEGPGGAEWDATVLACGGTVFHSSAWSRYICRARMNTSAIRFRLIDDEGQAVGAALGFRTRSANRIVSPLTSQLWFDALPAVQQLSGAQYAFVESLESYAVGAGDVELSFGSFGYRGGSEILSARRYALTQRLEFELDLSPSLEHLHKALEHKRRKNVNKSRRAGVLVEELGADEGLLQLYRVMDITWDRLELRGVKRSGVAQAGGSDAPERELLERGVGRLVGARLDGEWLTVSLFTHFAGQVYHVLSGHSPKALELQAPTLLLWESIAQFKSEGARWFNFGGCAASASLPDSLEHGVFDYKRAFGGATLECASGSRVLRPGCAALARLLRIVAGR